MFTSGKITYEVGGNVEATSYGGVAERGLLIPSWTRVRQVVFGTPFPAPSDR